MTAGEAKLVPNHMLNACSANQSTMLPHTMQTYFPRATYNYGKMEISVENVSDNITRFNSIFNAQQYKMYTVLSKSLGSAFRRISWLFGAF